tara:strand:- start:5 stop:1090 length:1086 start_codon:yes stop_codon:yes gene_type:complete
LKDLTFKHGGNIYSHAKRNNIPISNIIDSSASIVPFNPPKFLIKALYSEIKNGYYKYYPDKSFNNLKSIIGKFHNINPDWILPGNGASELITWVGLEASKIGKNCLPIPSFVDYERSLNCWNAEYIFSELPKDWPEKNLHEFPINTQSDVIWITNPHNPTGQLWSRKSLVDVLNKYKLVICDEAFLSITPNGENESLIPLIGAYDNLIVIRSLTKLFSIPGIRLGYLVSSSKKLELINKSRDPWPLNCFAIKAGKTLLKNQKNYNNWIKKIHNWIQIERPLFFNALSKNNKLKVHFTSTNFFLIESQKSFLPNIDYLESRGILIRECASFRSLNENWARISIQTHENNKKIANEIQKSFLN